jgi:hypothetical protein
MIAYATKEVAIGRVKGSAFKVGRVKGLFPDYERSLIAKRDAAGTAQRNSQSLAFASDDHVEAAVAEAVVHITESRLSST